MLATSRAVPIHSIMTTTEDQKISASEGVGPHRIRTPQLRSREPEDCLPSKRLSYSDATNAPSQQSRRPRKRSVKRSSGGEGASAKSQRVGDANQPIPLENGWTIWYDEKVQKGMEKAEYQENITPLGSFNTVQVSHR